MIREENLQYENQAIFYDDTDLIIETGTSGFINEVLSPTSGLTFNKDCCQKYEKG
jgi:hypothetical protein